MTGKDVTIPQLVLQLDLLRSQVFSLEQTKSELQHEIQRLHEEDQRLPDQIARLQRNSSNSSKPPSSDIVKPKNKSTSRRKGKRKIGGQQGHPRQERIPFSAEDIDATPFHVLPAEQVQDLIPLDDWFILQQVDLAEKLYRVTEHRARKYLDPRTGRIVIAPLPWVRQLFETWHRAESMTTAGYARTMDRIRRGFLKAVRRPPQRAEAQNLAARFRGAEADNYFRFLTPPGIEPTNNQTEQAIRRIVIDRHITQGTRGKCGQQWCQRVWTILATCRQQKRRVFEFFCQAINAHFQRKAALVASRGTVSCRCC